MNRFRIFLWCAMTSGTAAIVGCAPPAVQAPAHEPPAKVAHVAQEEKLNTIVLSPEAEKRLGIETATVERRSIRLLRTYGGEIVVPPGASLVISAPVGGKLSRPSDEAPPTVGALVAERQPLFVLTPLVSADREVLTAAERAALAQAKNAIATSRIDAQAQVQQAEVQVEAAQIAFDRAERLLREAAGTVRAVDDARAALSLAQKSLEAAKNRQRLLDELTLEGETSGKPTPILIEMPHAGMIRSQSVTAGEVVAAGAPLVEVLQFDPIWVRVPVYVGDVAELALDRSATVSPLGTADRSPGLVATPIAAPPTATALASTIDLYYALPNPDAQHRPGQRMNVHVERKSLGEELVAPWSAVMHDIQGGTWVYEATAPHTYVRRRVEVRQVVRDAQGELAVLAQGPKPGTKVVTTAVVELFGTEFGFAK
jgi:multidrug efflux pump subunit AcrA (membrane-fusion protein)